MENEKAVSCSFHHWEKCVNCSLFFYVAGVSPVFAGMLDSGTHTVPSSCLKIPDLDGETLEQMLEFIYNGEFHKDSLTDAMIVRLLECAHKYEISSLKAEILSRMSATLSIENVIQFVQAVKTHAAGDDGDKVIMHMLEFCKRY